MHRGDINTNKINKKTYPSSLTWFSLQVLTCRTLIFLLYRSPTMATHKHLSANPKLLKILWPSFKCNMHDMHSNNFGFQHLCVQECGKLLHVLANIYLARSVMDIPKSHTAMVKITSYSLDKGHLLYRFIQLLHVLVTTW